MKHYLNPIVEPILISGTDILTASLNVGTLNGEIPDVDYYVFS